METIETLRAEKKALAEKLSAAIAAAKRPARTETRVESLSRSFLLGGSKTEVSDRADRFYVESGGKSNPNEVRLYYPRVAEILETAGLVSVGKDGFVTVRGEVIAYGSSTPLPNVGAA